jgi:3-oxoacyl-[acyl-carrier protein] reductase
VTEIDPYLKGKVALVTGASRGIGRAIAVQLARRGASVACVATTPERAQGTVELCVAAGAKALPYGVDVGKTAAVAELVAKVQADFGGLDLLVNNAGITRDQLLLRMSEEDFDAVIQTNLKGTWNFVKAAARTLMKCQGRIVNIGSVVGVTGNAGQVNYAASKAGVFGLTRSAPRNSSGRGVTCQRDRPGLHRHRHDRRDRRQRQGSSCSRRSRSAAPARPKTSRCSSTTCAAPVARTSPARPSSSTGASRSSSANQARVRRDARPRRPSGIPRFTSHARTPNGEHHREQRHRRTRHQGRLRQMGKPASRSRATRRSSTTSAPTRSTWSRPS